MADFPEEIEKRAKAKAKREAREEKAKQHEAENVALTMEDVKKMKGFG